MRLKVLIANIALGMPGSNSPLQSLLHILHFYDWRVIPFLLTSGRLGSIIDYRARPDRRSVSYFAARSSVRPVLELIAREQPDIIVLNELLYQLHRAPLETGLRKEGFRHIAWGKSFNKPDLTASTVVASRLPCLEDGFAPAMTQLPQISGGGGIAGLRLASMPLTVVGFHLTKGLRRLSRRQIDELDGIYASELRSGRTTILAGDFNEHARVIEKVASLQALGLAVVVRTPTTPLGLPRFLEADYDHICLPPGWNATGMHYAAFGSDHLAVIAELGTA